MLLSPWLRRALVSFTWLLARWLAIPSASAVKVDFTPEKKVLVMWSMPRSGTSHLIRELGKHPCIANANEFLNPDYEDVHDPLNITTRLSDMMSMRLSDLLNGLNSKVELSDFVFTARQLVCPERLALPGGDGCMGRCVLVLKVFDVWRNSANKTGLAHLLQHEDVSTMVLHRDPKPMFCSLQHSYKYQDWGATPREHKARMANCSDIIARHPELLERRKMEQERWHKIAFTSLRGKDYLSVSFESITKPDTLPTVYAHIIGLVGLTHVSQGMEIDVDVGS